LRQPGAVFTVGHALDRLAQTVEAVGIAGPAMGAAHKAEQRPIGAALEIENREERQEVGLAGEPHHPRVEIAEGTAPLPRHGAKAFVLVAREQRGGVLRLDAKAIGRRRLEHRRAQLAQPGHGMLGGGGNLGPPLVLEIADTEEVGADFAEQLLKRQQSPQIDIARAQLDLGDEAIEHLKLDKTQIADRKPDRIVIGVGITQRRVKLVAIGQNPRSRRSNQHCQLLQTTPPLRRV